MKFKRFLLNTIASSDLLDHGERLWLYRCFGMRAGKVFIEPQVQFSQVDLTNVVLFDRVFINRGCFLDNAREIALGRNVCLAPRVELHTTTHAIGLPERRVGETCERAPIYIMSGCWLGAGVKVLPGVTIASGCVIAAGAVVNRDCLPHGLYAGVPAKRIKDLSIPGFRESQVLL